MAASNDGGGLGGLEARLAALRARMEAGLPARAQELRDAAAALESDPGAVAAIARCAHKLRGIAGSYGHVTLGESAARVETLAKTGSPDLAREALELARLITAAAAPAPSPTEATAAPTAKRLAGLRIAALDDDDATRRLLELTLIGLGGASAAVVATADALYAMADQELDLVIVDAMMPETSGIEVIHRLRGSGSTVRCAVLSAASIEELGWDLSSEPEIAWLRKPFRPADLVAAIADHVGRRHGG